MRRLLARYAALAPVVLGSEKLAGALACGEIFRSRPRVVRVRHECHPFAFQQRHACSVPRRRQQQNSGTSSGLGALKVDLSVENPFEQCWAANSWSVNAADYEHINRMVGSFNSPAPPSFFALTRALEQSHPSKKLEVFRIFTRMLKKGFYFVVRCSENGDVLEWQIMGNADRRAALGSDWQVVVITEPFGSTVQIAHHLLELTTEASERHERIDPSTLDALVDLAIERLFITLGTDSRGRSSADAAFAFAMAGVTRSELYRILAVISYLEIDRMGPRPSLLSRNILQIVEKLAAAGIQGPDVEPVYELAAEILSLKKDRPDSATIDALRSTEEGGRTFGMHSTRSLLWLWRFAARQSKAKIPAPEGKLTPFPLPSQGQPMSLDDNTWVERFHDPYRPLIVDVGSGMGVSLLGLSGYDHGEFSENAAGPLSSIDFSQCNFLGGDLKSLSVGYSSGIASRWGLDGKTQFLHQSAEELLHQVHTSYPGPIALILIQFPTPFRLATKTASDDGNAQLPTDAASGFMVTPALLQQAQSILQSSVNNNDNNNNNRGKKNCPPYLLFQSNVEDVAIAMRDMALEVGMECVDARSPVADLPFDATTGSSNSSSSSSSSFPLPKRTLDWIEAGGERAIGPEWSAEALLPRYGQTETEVACEFQGTPVHRCLLRPKRQPHEHE